jgi:pimeloyl-ACP methyl ester carboxylesterase
VIPALADAGYHVLAPDLRGYGRTTGWDEGDVAIFPHARSGAGLRRAAFPPSHQGQSRGGPRLRLAARRVLRAHASRCVPLGGADERAVRRPAGEAVDPRIHDQLAALGRKHYQWYYSTPEADADMRRCPQGIHAFLRAYYHMRARIGRTNKPYPLASWSAAELAKLPTYYVMRLGRTWRRPWHRIRQRARLPGSPMKSSRSMPTRSDNGFQGGLNWYRCTTSAEHSAPLRALAGRTIDVPSMYIAGASDWGIYQKPGRLRAHAVRRLHAHVGLPPRARRRPLGAAGAIGAHQRAAARILGSGSQLVFTYVKNELRP